MTAGGPREWAQRYADGGLPVLALHSARGGGCSCGRSDCHSPGKHPLTAHGKDDATTDGDQVARWWEWWPWANVGVRPPAGIAVLDVDPRNQGDVALLDLTRRRGALPRTLTARTGSGGLHIWLAYGGHARGQLCHGVDVKTNRGYLVAPPSAHVSGGSYEWIVECRAAPAPEWVRRLLNPPAPAYIPRVGAMGSLDALLRWVAADPGGELNNRLYWASCRALEAGLDVNPLVDLAVSMGHPHRGAVNTAASAANAPPRMGATR